MTFTTEPENRWQLTAKYVNVEITEWGTTEDGKSYGAQNENGTPDMIAVLATNGTPGYVYRTELEEADGTAVPVYDTTGKTVVGKFVIAPGNGQIGGTPSEGSFPTAPVR